MDSLKLILVDDDNISLIINRQFLKRNEKIAAAKIMDFNKPQEAAEFLKSEIRQLTSNRYWVLLDINMPLMTGWELLDEIKEDNKHKQVKVIMLTSSISEDDRMKIDEYNFVYGFISKPISDEKVDKIVSTILAN
ncbi:response regulator [Algoriphagus namhaensis]